MGGLASAVACGAPSPSASCRFSSDSSSPAWRCRPRAGSGIATRNAIGTITFSDLPASLQTPPLSQRSVIKASDGSTIATFYYENRQSVSLSEVAPTMRQAIVAIEDSRFYEHHGVDPKGILRAL